MKKWILTNLVKGKAWKKIYGIKKHWQERQPKQPGPARGIWAPGGSFCIGAMAVLPKRKSAEAAGKGGKNRMMEMEEFAQAVLAAVEGKMDGAFGAQIHTVVKNNGGKLTGICISRTGSNIGPCIYLDGCYGEYRRGYMGVREIAENVWRRFMEHEDDMEDIRAEDFLRWGWARRRIYPRLVNAGMNRESLGMMPHRHFLDLAVLYYIKMEGAAETGKTASILVQDGHMEAWGQDEKGLFQAAAANMRMGGV